MKPASSRTPVRAHIYDALLVRVTSRWYREVLERVPPGARLLDVGIGTGSALARNAAVVKKKHLEITGLDIDRDYLEKCRANIQSHGLEDNVEVRLESVYDHQGGPYDTIYFASSFMLLPDPKGALLHVQKLLAGEGEIVFTQTFQDSRSGLMERIKPQLHRATTVRFGRVTYLSEFLRQLEDADLHLAELEVLQRIGTRSYRLAVAKPVPAADVG